MAETAQVTITVSEKMSVTGPGFRHDMECRPIQWGTVGIPYKIWRHIIENLIPALNEKEIPIAAETFEIWIGRSKIGNPRIKVSHSDKLALEIPVDAKPIEIVEYALGRGIRQVRASVVWNTVSQAVDRVRREIERAWGPLKKYGVEPEDLIFLVSAKVGIEDRKGLCELLFPRR